MSESLERIKDSKNTQLDIASKLNDLKAFVDTLNSEPRDEDIEENKLVSLKDGGHPLYVPIGVIERKLDELFYGLYSITVKDTKIIANEIMMVVTLEIFHPIAKVWLKRDGVGGSMIRMKSGSDITDMNAKIKNAVTADGPRAYSEAIKNAAKRFGNIFGANLNRNENFLDEAFADDLVFEDFEIKKMETEAGLCTTFKELKEWYEDVVKNNQKRSESLTILKIANKNKKRIKNEQQNKN